MAGPGGYGDITESAKKGRRKPPTRPRPGDFGEPGPGGSTGPPGPDKGDKKEQQKKLEQWLARQERRALAGGLLSGPSGGADLVNLLRSNPDLALRVREWMEANPAPPGVVGALANAGAGGRQSQLLAAFPELFQQYVAATGMSIVYDAEGNAVRLVDPAKPYGMREGDVFTTPTLFGAAGEELPLPTLESDNEAVNFAPVNTTSLRFGAIPQDAETSGMLGELFEARQRRARLPQGQAFSYDEIVGGTEE